MISTENRVSKSVNWRATYVQNQKRGPDYDTINCVCSVKDGRRLIFFMEKFYRPAEPGDLKK